MSAPRVVWEVARRELVERSRSRVFQFSLVLMLILSAGGAVAAARLTGLTPTDHVGLVGARSVALQATIQAQAKAAGRRVQFRSFATATTADRAVRDGAIDLALLDGSRIVVKTSRTGAAVREVEQAVAAQSTVDRLRSAGLTQTQVLSVLSAPVVPVDVLEPRPANYDRNQGLVSAGLFALFIVLVFFAQAVAQGVTEEKSSRVVELLLTSVSPRRLLAGKILGIGLLGLALLLLPSAAALAAGRLAGGAGLPSAAPAALALIVLWFVLGYIFYSVVFAAVGALVSRQEDLTTAMLPVNAVMVGAFYLALFVVNTNPNGTVARVAAFVPPVSPMVVPARMVLGDMTGFGLAIAIVLEMIGTGVMILLAARAYERAILRIGAPVKLHRLFARRSQPTPAEATGPRLSPRADLALRMFGAVLVVAGALIGFGHPVAIVLVAVGLLMFVLEQTLKHPPRRGAH